MQSLHFNNVFFPSLFHSSKLNSQYKYTNVYLNTHTHRRNSYKKLVTKNTRQRRRRRRTQRIAMKNALNSNSVNSQKKNNSDSLVHTPFTHSRSFIRSFCLSLQTYNIHTLTRNSGGGGSSSRSNNKKRPSHKTFSAHRNK